MHGNTRLRLWHVVNYFNGIHAYVCMHALRLWHVYNVFMHACVRAVCNSLIHACVGVCVQGMRCLALHGASGALYAATILALDWDKRTATVEWDQPGVFLAPPGEATLRNAPSIVRAVFVADALYVCIGRGLGDNACGVVDFRAVWLSWVRLCLGVMSDYLALGRTGVFLCVWDRVVVEYR